MEDNDIFINFKYGDQIELADVSANTEDFPTYRDFVKSAQDTFEIPHPIYFANQVNARLREKIFIKYVKKFHTRSDFILYVKDEDPLNKKGQFDEDIVAGPSTSVRSSRMTQQYPSNPVHYSPPQVMEQESDTLAYSDTSLQDVLQINVITKEEPMQEILPEISIQDNFSNNSDSSSTPNPTAPRQSNRTKKRPLPLERGINRNPNNVCVEQLTANELMKYISECGGQNIFDEYERDGTLSEVSRKQFVRIVAQHLTTNFGFYSAKETKIAYAKLCVQILPKYKTSSEYNYDFFFDPTTTRGALGDKLHYLQTKGRKEGKGVYLTKKRRQAEMVSTSADTVSEQEATLTVDESTALANIEFIRNATIDDKQRIIQAFRDNRDHRVANSRTIVDDYINAFRLVPTLLVADFDFTFGTKNVMSYWSQIERTVDPIYVKHHRKKVLDSVILDWAEPVQTILKVLSFVPPGNRGTLKNTVDSMIMFFRTGTSIDTIQTTLNATDRNVQIYAMGLNKKKISSFHLKIEDLLLRVSSNAYEALDTFLKIHFSLNIEYSKLHGTFLRFLQHYVYKIPIQETTHAMKSLALELQIE